MVEKPQKIRYSNDELQLLKNTFVDNEQLLKSVRKVMLQLDLPESEDVLLRKIMTDKLAALLRKMFLPEIDGDAPLHQVIDLWMTVEIKDKDPEFAYVLLKSREKLIEYLDQQLKVLSNKKTDIKIILDDNKGISTKGRMMADCEQLYINITFRNTLIGHIEQQLDQIRMLAGRKEETPEETLKRLHQNSSK